MVLIIVLLSGSNTGLFSAQGPLHCPWGASSSLLGPLTLRSYEETKLSELSHYSPVLPALPPPSLPASALLSPGAGAVALASAPGGLVAGWEDGRSEKEGWLQPCRLWRLRCIRAFGRVWEGEGLLGSGGRAWVIENTELC